MRFSVDAHAIGRHLTGNEVYIRGLLQGLAAVARGSEFVAYVSAAEARDAVPQSVALRRVSANPFVRLGWELSWRVRRDCASLLHVQYTGPLACPSPLVVSVHDVSFEEHPEFFPAVRAAQLRHTVPLTVRRAARVLTCSEFSRRRIAAAYGLNPDDIVVAPNAAAPEFRPISREAARAAVAQRFGIPHRFLLSVGNLQPRKNQIGLIRAFASMVQAHPELPHRLVIAGQETWFAGRVKDAAAASGVSGRIHFIGFVSDEDLLQLYNACDLFVFPSYYEGFGIPVLEAMACGRAVVCSSASALPEVADGAAILFDPHSTAEMARAMVDVLVEPELRARMERMGVQRAARFSWLDSARRTLDVYQEVAQSRAPAAAAARAASIPQ